MAHDVLDSYIFWTKIACWWFCYFTPHLLCGFGVWRPVYA